MTKNNTMAPMPAVAFRWYAVVSLLIISFFIQPSSSIYCDDEDCYDLLGVTQTANASEIKKAYYKLSLKHHPDKNPDPESKKLFVKIANAYEILKDEATREQYDYAIAHPEEVHFILSEGDGKKFATMRKKAGVATAYQLTDMVFYNTACYYHAYYGHKTDPRAVIVGLILVLSAFQYLNQWTRYHQAIDMVKRTPAYKNRLKALEYERTGGLTTKKKTHKQTDTKLQDDLSKELELQIKGAEKPSMWELLGVRIILLPYTVGKLFLWYSGWFWRYKVRQAPYSWEDASYMTRRSLGAPVDSWRDIDESRKEDLIERRLWEKSNLESYLAELRKESKRRR